MKPHKFLFILSLPFSGSTLLVKLIGTSHNASIFNSPSHEGQMLDEVKHIMREKPWDPNIKFPWNFIKEVFMKNWDLSKQILVEKSPPNIICTDDIVKAFDNIFFIITIRNPYAWCASMKRRFPDMENADIVNSWLQKASYQIQNIKNLKNALFFKYEELCDRPSHVKDKIEQFIPELSDIHIDEEFSVHSMIGNHKKPIINFNDLEISLLKTSDIDEISSILKNKENILRFFSYDIL